MEMSVEIWTNVSETSFYLIDTRSTDRRTLGSMLYRKGLQQRVKYKNLFYRGVLSLQNHR